MHKLKIEISKFTIVGALNFCLTFIVFFTLLKLFKSGYLVALSLAWVLGVIFSYVLNFVWVFKSDDRLVFKERFVKYFMAYFVSFILNLFALRLIVEKFGFDPFYVQTALIPCIVILNFSTSKLWSLRQSDKNT
ncbi:MAG: hypothetical protein A2W23_10270 [Planctomycetes bacterium RBG_16_43_13]|nr:MAG: hypothetical protein A2W23_10270 [Planctomycetes bacterium RBG_16_43_13]